MTPNVKSYKIHQVGFTIVELLIVIVVIAILAAISIVSFTGVQDRAHRSTNIQGLSQFAKAAIAYSTINSAYPVAGNHTCLHDTASNNQCSNVGNGLVTCFGMGMGMVNTTTDTALKTVVDQMPKVSDQTGMCGGQPYRGTYFTVGADGKSATLHSYWKGDIECPPVSSVTLSSRAQQDDLTLCRYDLPAL